MKSVWTLVVAGMVLVSACDDKAASPATTAVPAETTTSTAASISAPAPATTSATTETSASTLASAPSTTTNIQAPSPTAPSAPTITDLLELGRPLVIAHTAGEDEFPGSTMFAFAESVKAGVDVLDLNVLLSSDGQLMIQHDETVERTSDGSGRVDQMTAAELQTLDNAYWFTAAGLLDDRPVADYLYRGMRTGEVAPPAGYTADDFTIPTLDQLMDRFPEMPLGIEIKGSGESAQRTADALLKVLDQRNHLASTVISSFDDATVSYLHSVEPNAILSPGIEVMTAWVLNRTPLPDGMRILQLPPFYGENDSIQVITDELIARSHDAGYVIWIWPNNRKFENAATYREYLDWGIDGLNINFPTQAMDVLRSHSG